MAVLVRLGVRLRMVAIMFVIMVMAVLVRVIVAMPVAVIVLLTMAMAMVMIGGLRGNIQHIVAVAGTVVMLMPATAVIAVCMVMIVCVVFAMRVCLFLIIPMIVTMLMTVTMVVATMVVSSTLRLEGAAHHLDRAALPAHHLGQHVIVLDVNRISGDLGGCVAIAEVPGQPHEPERIVGSYLEQALRRGIHRDQPAIIELQRVAIGQHGGLVEIKQNLLPSHRQQHGPPAGPILMRQCHAVDDPFDLNSRLADGGRGALHVGVSSAVLLCI